MQIGRIQGLARIIGLPRRDVSINGNMTLPDAEGIGGTECRRAEHPARLRQIAIGSSWSGIRRASAAFMLVQAMLPARAEGLIEKWKTVDFGGTSSVRSDVANLYPRQREVMVAYVAAMRRYEAAAGNTKTERIARAFRPRDQPFVGEPWTWIASNGDLVRREEIGTFGVFRGNYPTNWFTKFDCSILEWPMFLCSDGRTRKMSAPDPTTMILDGVEYKRFAPAYP